MGSTFGLRILFVLTTFAITPAVVVSADTVTVTRGQKLIVTVPEAAIVDRDKNVQSKVTKGEVLLVSHDARDAEWIPVEFTLNGELKYGGISTSHVRVVGMAENFMTRVLAVLVHLLVIGGIVLMLVFLVRTILDGDDFMERLLRSVSFAAGLLAYVAARAYGFSIPDLLAASLNVVSPIVTGVWGVLVPFATGTFVAWFCLRMITKGEDIGKRVTLLFCAFVFTMFSDVYATLAGEIGVSQSKFGLPNCTFVLGVVLYTIFKYQRPKGDTSLHGHSSMYR